MPGEPEAWETTAVAGPFVTIESPAGDVGIYEGGPIDHGYARRTLDEWEKPVRLGRPKPDPRLRKLAAEAERREDAAATAAEQRAPGTPARLRAEADYHDCVVATFRANQRAGQGLYPGGLVHDPADVYAWHTDRAERLRREADATEAQPRACQIRDAKERRRAAAEALGQRVA